IQAEIAEAEQQGNYHNIEKLHHEYDALLSHISSAFGLGKRARLTNSNTDKARAAVTLRIKSVIKKIRETHPQLAEHFEASIKTGTFCTYKPELKVNWELSEHV